ncbi:solute carrier family 25 member 43 isoform X2 [Stigmatopora nigra]
MGSVKKDNRLTSWQSFSCVAFSGIFSKSATSPLEVVKIKSQVGTFHCKKGFGQTFLLIYQNEGLKGFWKGNLTSCLRLFPYTAVHLSTYRKIVHLHVDQVGVISQARAIMAGGLAGVAAALLTYPLEVAETRLIAQNCREPSYVGVMRTLAKIQSSEGLLALYRGFSLTVLGAFPFSLGCYLVYTNVDRVWLEPPFRLSPLQNFINGCLAAAVAQTLSYPFETVKRKMQIVPYFGLLFACFELCKQLCLYRNGYIVSPLSYTPAPGVDQSLGPAELQEVNRYLRNRSFRADIGNRW